MNEKTENVWRTGLIRGALPFGSFGLVMMILILVLPASFYEGKWNETLILGFNMRDAIFGGGLGFVLALLLQQDQPIMFVIFVTGGLLLWLLGEQFALLPPVISIPLGLLLGRSATRDLLKQIEKIKGYSSKVGSTGDERNQIVEELFEVIVSSRSENLRTTAAHTMKVFGKDGMESLLKNLEYPHPQARQRIAYALGIVGDKEAITPLQTLAEKEQDSVVKQSALEAVSHIQKREDS